MDARWGGGLGGGTGLGSSAGWLNVKWLLASFEVRFGVDADGSGDVTCDSDDVGKNGLMVGLALSLPVRGFRGDGGNDNPATEPNATC